MSTSLRNYTKALYGFDAVIQRVPSDRWDADSPCEGWSARDVVVHACGVMQAVEAMARTGENVSPATPDPVDDIVELWNSTRDDLLEALDHPNVLNASATTGSVKGPSTTSWRSPCGTSSDTRGMSPERSASTLTRATTWQKLRLP